MKRFGKNPSLRHDANHLPFITIGILITGFIFWYAYALSVLPTPSRCMPPSEYWLDSRPPLYTVFSITFLSLLLWNIAELAATTGVARVSRTYLAIFLLNSFALVSIGYTINRLHNHIENYDRTYEAADARWNTTDKGYDWSMNDCMMSKPYVGVWKTEIIGPKEDDLAFIDKKLELKRSLRFETYGARLPERHTGGWKAPIYKDPGIGRYIVPSYWHDVFWLVYSREHAVNDSPFRVVELTGDRIVMQPLEWDYKKTQWRDLPQKLILTRITSEAPYIRTGP